MEIQTLHYQGQDRRIVRSANIGDKGFDPEAEAGSQVVVKMGGGAEIVVAKEEEDVILDAPPPVKHKATTTRRTPKTVKRILPDEPRSYNYENENL